MKGFQKLKPVCYVAGLGLSLCLVSACTSSVTQDESSVAEERQEPLGGAGSTGSCKVRDSADTTCDGCTEPAVHAEPLEAQMPSRSRPASSAMLTANR